MVETSGFSIRPLPPEDRPWVAKLVIERWGSDRVISHRRGGSLVPFEPHTLPGFVATMNGELMRLVTYNIEGEEWEIASLDSLRRQIGVGTALLELALIYRNAIEKARKFKPQIPLISRDGTPPRDDIELEMNL